MAPPEPAPAATPAPATISAAKVAAHKGFVTKAINFCHTAIADSSADPSDYVVAVEQLDKAFQSYTDVYNRFGDQEDYEGEAYAHIQRELIYHKLCQWLM